MKITLGLKNYVKNGGHLIIETNRELESGQALPDPFPIRKVKPSQKSGSWNFKGIEVKEWAKTILTSEGKPVLVEGSLGEGRVLWSGINLPFHITNSKNETEAQLLKKILQGFSFTPHQDLGTGFIPNQNLPQFAVEFKNPQERVLLLKDKARGVLFKENYFPNWQAKAKTANNQTVKLKIYPAGPGFMFAYLPQGTKEVVFLYRRSWVEKIADFISLLTFAWLILLLIPFSRRPFSSPQIGGHQK